MIGTTLGHYRIVRQLGSGGMGEVYAAQDLELGREVAIKVLPEALSRDDERRTRLEREARAAASLNHPNIVTLHSVERVGNAVFLTMELVDGRPLSELIPRGGMPLDRLLKFAIPLVDALAAAHQRGIIHRDLKPSNVMVTADERVKVLDFGLAKIREVATSPLASSLTTEEVTGEGRIMGTAAYMSPEQAEGKAVDQRSDLFSLGVILYEMATGERPFKGSTGVSIISAILKDTPRPVTEIRADLPRDFARIVKRCLMKDPEQRFQSAKDLRNDLTLLKDEIGSGAPSQTKTRLISQLSLRQFRTALFIACVAAAVAMSWVIYRQRTNQVKPGPFETVRVSPLTLTGTVRNAAISPDGKYLAYTNRVAGAESVWLRQLSTRPISTTSAVQIVPPSQTDFDSVAFSPDGGHLFYHVYPRGEGVATLYRLPVLGGTPRKVLVDIDSAVTFSPDGQRFAFLRGYVSGERAIILANVDGSGERVLASTMMPDGFLLTSVAWSPDGKTIVAAQLNTKQGRKMHLVAVNVDSGDRQQIGATRWLGISSIAWIDGKTLAITALDVNTSVVNEIWLVSYPAGNARVVTRGGDPYGPISVSADGRAIVGVKGNAVANAWVLPEGDVRRAVQITSGSSSTIGLWGMDWTPDGRIVFTSVESGTPNLWIMNADGSDPRQVTSDFSLDQAPSVTPDSRVVLFDRFEIWRVDVDGGHLTPLTKNMQGRFPLPVDRGKAVMFTSGAANVRGVWRVSIDGGTPEPVFGPDAKFGSPLPLVRLLSVSPDEQLASVFYDDNDLRGTRLALLSLKDGRVVQKFNLPVAAAATGRSWATTWTPDGAAFDFVDFRDGAWNIWRQPIAGGSPKQITSFDRSQEIFSFAWSRDGTRLACSRGTVSTDAVLLTSLDDGR
jgi:serine/threonine protein kinase